MGGRGSTEPSPGSRGPDVKKYSLVNTISLGLFLLFSKERENRHVLSITLTRDNNKVGESDYRGVVGDEIGQGGKKFLHVRQIGFPVGLRVEVAAEDETSGRHRGVTGEQDLEKLKNFEMRRIR